MTAPVQTAPVTWPRETLPILERALTVEYASLTRAGAPITVPVTPYLGSGPTLDLATGLTYPSKAERARRNPKVALLYADAVGSGLPDAPVVLVQGTAAVRDGDLQANTDRYVRLSSAKLPQAYAGMPDVLLRRLGWYFARIWVEVTPSRILWWPHGDLESAPEEWRDSSGKQVPASDPAPAAAATATASAPAPAPRPPLTQAAIGRLRHRDLTCVDGDGYPVTVPVRGAEVTGDGVRLTLPAGVRPLVRPGPACLTCHDHDAAFSQQENCTVVGTLSPGPEPLLTVDRVVETLSLPAGAVRRALTLLRWQRRYAPRLAAEAARRGQPVPVVDPALVARAPG